MSKLPIFELILSVGNLKPKPKRFFKLKLKPKLFLLNCHPEQQLLGTPWPPLYNAAIVTELTETACNDCEEE